MGGQRRALGAALVLAAAWVAPLFGCATPTLELRTPQTPLDFGYRGGEGRQHAGSP